RLAAPRRRSQPRITPDPSTGMRGPSQGCLVFVLDDDVRHERPLAFSDATLEQPAYRPTRLARSTTNEDGRRPRCRPRPRGEGTEASGPSPMDDHSRAASAAISPSFFA